MSAGGGAVAALSRQQAAAAVWRQVTAGSAAQCQLSAQHRAAELGRRVGNTGAGRGARLRGGGGGAGLEGGGWQQERGDTGAGGPSRQFLVSACAHIPDSVLTFPAQLTAARRAQHSSCGKDSGVATEPSSHSAGRQPARCPLDKQ